MHVRGVRQVWRVLGAMLHVGNLQFGGGESAELEQASEGALRSASALLGLQVAALRHALVTRCIKAGTEFISTPNTDAAAAELRDGLAKALYARLFARLLEGINAGLARRPQGGAPEGVGGSAHFIGVLDIFGFEIFGVNSLEQLLINYTNEALQAIFNEIIFSAAQQARAASPFLRVCMRRRAASARPRRRTRRRGCRVMTSTPSPSTTRRSSRCSTRRAPALRPPSNPPRRCRRRRIRLIGLRSSGQASSRC